MKLSLTLPAVDAVHHPRGSARAIHAFSLLDCLIYIAVTTLILGLSFGAFLETLDRSTELDRVATTMIQALQAGEQWREDIRSAQAPPTLVTNGTGIELRIATPAGTVGYAFADSLVRRRATPTSPWIDLVPHVKSSGFSPELRPSVAAWRWDLDLSTRRDRERFQRTFRFIAVPAAKALPRPDARPEASPPRQP